MSASSDRGSGYRRTSSTDAPQHRQVAEKPTPHSRRVRGFARDSSSLRRTVSTSEENVPTALPLLLHVVWGPERLPADEELQEVLRGKLRILQADSPEVNALFTELSTHLISINSEEKVIFVSFKTFEEIWKFTTYYTIGFLGQCMETLLWDQKLWLSSLEEDIAIEVSLQEDTLHLIYKGILMQEGSLFASCSSNQMFDSSTSGGDLYLEQGDIAQFEPPFLGSGWTVLCLADGARGTAPKPGLEPVVPFHQWFLKSCAESILVGDGKPSCDFPLQFARGSCLATVEYDAGGPDELSVAPGDRIIIVGLLVSCFDWFTGRKEATGEVGLVKTSLVKPYTDIYDSADIFLDGEEETFFSLQEDKVIEETNALLKKKSHNDIGHNYKLDMISYQDAEEKTLLSSSSNVNTQQTDLKTNIQRVLDQGQDSLPASMVTVNGTPADSVLATEAKGPSPPCFTVHPVVEGDNNTDIFVPLLSFLEGRDYKVEFITLYGRSSELLASSTFTGHSDEDELIAFLSVARETARKKRLLWSHTRLCFLLGKLCSGRSKFSQARVYFEEALGVPREGFADLRLLASIYSNLVTIYLLQKNTESFFALTERLVALLLGIPDCLECLEDNSTLKYILKKAVLSHNKMAEARACHLLAKHHWTRAEGVGVVPYLERLLVLCAEAQRTWGNSPSHEYLALGRLYSELRLPHLSVSSASRASQQPSATLTDCLSSMRLLLDNVNRLNGIAEQEASIPPQGAPYLHRALSSNKVQGGGSDQHHVLSHQLTVCLCQLFCEHRMVGRAIGHMHTLIDRNPPSQRPPISVPERNGTLIWLAWLHIVSKQPDVALDILDAVLASMPEHCTTPQEGVVLNMRGVALRCTGDLRRAAESYQAAVDICQEYEDMPNWAVAQANLGLLCLKGGAKGLALRHLTEAVQLFSELDEGHEANFITVLLELGQHYVKQHQLDFGKGCYEWALLLAINANLLDCQLTATRHLCHLYGCESPDQAQCIIYSQHQVQLLTHTGDRGQEGEALEAISQLYLTLGTERAYRAALGYTKTSLGIFIDLGCREKEAYGWLQAGKIYQLVDQIELVDLYIQVAQDVALSTGDTGFLLKLLEAAGDIFFNSSQERDKAITFYRDRALPIAVKSSSVRSRLRLCNKLTELMLNLKLYEEAVEFAQTALDISITLGECLNERVAYHRLASLYHCLDQYELAEHYYLKTLTLCPTPLRFDEETLYYVRVYQTLGDIMFYDLKDPFDAAGYYHLALAAAMDLGNKRSQLQLCTRLATIYHNFLIDRELSLFFYQKARAFAAELNVRRINISPDQQYKTTIGQTLWEVAENN
ncbi:SH3 domain and tetratricopeptide repeat-containing protein 1 [Cyclopterus lumpus]|uniref:SH3 domain and tetratricopeptide repeat-containing protein 1 n=1 Tax=Cyclopterus lumpus TaxID=8103 RepID=UPI001485FF0D|nr:SH3 domain and tetratricopeptide repeat-containing protein 1 [Cyclopterus lumpus]